MIGQRFKICWSVLILLPLVAYMDGSYGSSTIALLAGMYVLGWCLLVVALRRDPDCRAVLGQHRFNALAAGLVGMALVAQLTAPVVRSVDVVIAAELFVVVLLLLWCLFPTGARLRRAVAKLTLLVLSLGLCFLVGEGICRLPVVVRQTGGTTLAVEEWHQDHYDGIWRNNVFGLRSFHVEEPKPQGVFRIAVVGDSFSWGDKIGRTEDVWPYVLERQLNQSGRRVQVINLSRNGYSTVNESEMLRRMGWMFQIDLLLLQYTLNDPLPSGPNLRRGSESQIYRTVSLMPVWRYNQLLSRRSYLYAFLNNRLRRLQMRVRYPQGRALLFEDDFEGWHASQAAIMQMADWSRQRHIPMLVMLFPSLGVGNLGDDTYRYLEVHRKIEAAVAKAGVPIVDIRPVLNDVRSEARSWWALPWNAHPNVEAHDLAGRTIAAQILRRKLLTTWEAAASSSTTKEPNSYQRGTLPMPRAATS